MARKQGDGVYIDKNGIARFRTRVRVPDPNAPNGYRDERPSGTAHVMGYENNRAGAKKAMAEAIGRLLHPEQYAVTAPGIVAAAPGASSPTVAKLIERYDGKDREGKPGAIRTRWCHLRGPVLRWFGPMQASTITQGDVNRFRDSLPGEAQTVKNKIYAFFALLRWAADDNLIPPHNLKCSVKPRSAKAEVSDVRAVAVKDIELLIDECQDLRFEVAILLACEAGLRIGEIRGLEWSDIGKHGIKVRREIDDRNHIGPPKNGYERTVPSTTRIDRALDKLRKTYATIGGYVLQRREQTELQRKRATRKNTSPGNSIGYPALYDAACAFYDRAGVERGELESGGTIHVWHSLRHTYGTTLVHDDVPLKRVMLLMGHKDVRTTDRYITTTQEQLRADVRRVFG